MAENYLHQSSGLPERSQSANNELNDEYTRDIHAGHTTNGGMDARNGLTGAPTWTNYASSTIQGNFDVNIPRVQRPYYPQNTRNQAERFSMAPQALPFHDTFAPHANHPTGHQNFVGRRPSGNGIQSAYLPGNASHQLGTTFAGATHVPLPTGTSGPMSAGLMGAGPAPNPPIMTSPTPKTGQTIRRGNRYSHRSSNYYILTKDDKDFLNTQFLLNKKPSNQRIAEFVIYLGLHGGTTTNNMNKLIQWFCRRRREENKKTVAAASGAMIDAGTTTARPLALNSLAPTMTSIQSATTNGGVSKRHVAVKKVHSSNENDDSFDEDEDADEDVRYSPVTSTNGRQSFSSAANGQPFSRNDGVSRYFHQQNEHRASQSSMFGVNSHGRCQVANHETSQIMMQNLHSGNPFLFNSQGGSSRAIHSPQLHYTPEFLGGGEGESSLSIGIRNYASPSIDGPAPQYSMNGNIAENRSAQPTVNPSTRHGQGGPGAFGVRFHDMIDLQTRGNVDRVDDMTRAVDYGFGGVFGDRGPGFQPNTLFENTLEPQTGGYVMWDSVEDLAKQLNQYQ